VASANVEVARERSGGAVRMSIPRRAFLFL